MKRVMMIGAVAAILMLGLLAVGGAAAHDRENGSRSGPGGMLDTLADFLGLADGDEIIDARQNGESLVEVAEGQGIEESELTGFILDRLETRLADAVESGRITQEQADEKLANAPVRLGERINSTEFPPEGKFGEGRFGKGRWRHHMDDHHTDDDTVTQ